MADAGGIPITVGHEIVDAIGGRGGTVDQEQQVAEAGVAAYRSAAAA